MDISKQERMESEIKDKINTLKDIEGIANLGYWSLDLINNKLYWSKGVYSLFDLKPNEFEATYDAFLEHIHPSDRDRVKTAYTNSLKNKTEYRIEHRLIINNKVKYVLEYCKTYYEENIAIRSLGVIIDITKEKNMEKELSKARNIKALGLVAGGVAHNLNNLLAIIQGHLDLSDNNSNNEAINIALKRIGDLSQKMLIFAKGGDPIKLVIDKFSSILNKFILELLSGCNIKLEFIEIEDSFKLDIDEKMIKNVIENIILNTKEAYEDNNIQEDKEIKVSLEIVGILESCKYSDHDKHIKISIKDNAGGINNPESIDDLLLPYFTTKNNKIGLGLTIAKSIIEKHNGQFFIKTEKFFGTEVIIILPIVSESTKLALSNKDLKSFVVTNPKKILIMDDEELILKMCQKFLKYKDYDVEIALHGREAVEKYKEAYNHNDKYLMVILDLIIPNGMGGEEAAREIYKIDKYCKLVVSSGYSNSDALSNYKNYGFVDSLPKPYNLNELLDIVKTCENNLLI